MATAMSSRRLSLLNTTLAIILCILVWQVASMWLGEDTLAGPHVTTIRLEQILTMARYRGDLESTATGFFLALAIAWIGGLALGIWFGMRRLAGDVAEPLLVSFYSIPKVTLYPIVLLVCGLGMPAKVTFGVIHGIVPVVLITMAAIRNIRPVYLRTACAMQLSHRDTVLHVLLPAVLPQIIGGLRIGFSLTLLGTLIGEMFGGQGGLGYMLIRAINLAKNDTIMAVASLLLIFALIGNWLLGHIAEHLSGH
jgi:NitT/TauT family transport system permease protein